VKIGTISVELTNDQVEYLAARLAEILVPGLLPAATEPVDDLLTIEEVYAAIGIPKPKSRTTIARHLQNGTLPPPDEGGKLNAVKTIRYWRRGSIAAFKLSLSASDEDGRRT